MPVHNSFFALSPVGLDQYLLLAAVLFTTGVVGVLVRRNALVIMMSIELMLNAANIVFVAYSRYMNNLDGQVMVFFVVAIAACEAAIGLAIAVAIYRRLNAINIRFFEHLKG
jgi:NADH-quinone oxidoreductase subunit K